MKSLQKLQRKVAGELGHPVFTANFLSVINKQLSAEGSRTALPFTQGHASVRRGCDPRGGRIPVASCCQGNPKPGCQQVEAGSSYSPWKSPGSGSCFLRVAGGSRAGHRCVPGTHFLSASPGAAWACGKAPGVGALVPGDTVGQTFIRDLP